MGLLGCVDSVWEPGAPAGGNKIVTAEVVSHTEIAADLDTLPDWASVLKGMESLGCGLHFRRVTGKYEPVMYVLKYSNEAKDTADGWQALIYNVLMTVTRPTEDGETEVLPQRLAIRAVCAMPKSDLGATEAKDWVEALLEGKGIVIPGKAQALGPARERSRWAWMKLGWAWDWLSPRPLNAAQGKRHRCIVSFPPPDSCRLPDFGEPVEHDVAIDIGCPTGFDYEGTKGTCALHTLTPINGGVEVPGGPGSSSPGSSSPGDGADRNNGDDGEDGDDTEVTSGQFRLNCRGGTRGQESGCRVTVTDSTVLSSLYYVWTTGARAAADSGWGKVEWMGRATSTRSVVVNISGPDLRSTKTLPGVVNVKPRMWTFTPPTPADTSAAVYGGANWNKGKWGDHDSGSTSSPQVMAGSGPWKGMFMGTDAPIHNGNNRIRLHFDFKPNGSPHPRAQSVACFAATSSATSANVVAVNAECSTSSQLSSWRRQVLLHEKAHATSGDKCLTSATTADKIRELERITGGDADYVRDELHRVWSEFWSQTVLPAFEGGLSTPTSPRIWEYRFRKSWNRHALTGGQEGGTNGCPP